MANIKASSIVVGSSTGQSHTAGNTSPTSSGTRTHSPTRDISPPPKQRVSPSAVASLSPPSKSLTGMKLQTSDVGEPIVRKGTAGKTAKMTANYVKLNVEGEKGMYEYEVRFDPLVDSKDESVS